MRQLASLHFSHLRNDRFSCGEYSDPPAPETWRNVIKYTVDLLCTRKSWQITKAFKFNMQSISFRGFLLGRRHCRRTSSCALRAVNRFGCFRSFLFVRSAWRIRYRVQSNESHCYLYAVYSLNWTHSKHALWTFGRKNEAIPLAEWCMLPLPSTDKFKSRFHVGKHVSRLLRRNLLSSWKFKWNARWKRASGTRFEHCKSTDKHTPATEWDARNTHISNKDPRSYHGSSQAKLVVCLVDFALHFMLSIPHFPLPAQPSNVTGLLSPRSTSLRYRSLRTAQKNAGLTYAQFKRLMNAHTMHARFGSTDMKNRWEKTTNKLYNKLSESMRLPAECKRKYSESCFYSEHSLGFFFEWSRDGGTENGTWVVRTEYNGTW